MTEHSEVVEGFEAICSRTYDLSTLLARAEQNSQPRLADVKELVEFGSLALAVPSEYDGLGMSSTDVAATAVLAGRYLLPLHLTNTMFVAGPALACASDGALADDLVTGKIVVATGINLAPGSRPRLDAEWPAWVPADAGLLVLAQPRGICAYNLDESWLLRDVIALDPGEGLRLVTTDQGFATPVVALKGWLAERTLQQAQLSLCAQALGCASQVLRQSVSYADDRQQFGVSISSFQSLAHLLANMHTSVVLGESMLSRAAHLLEAGSPEARQTLASLVHWLPARARQVCEQAIQVHGGAGFTWELGLHLHYRRVLTVQSLLGGDRGSARRAASVYLRDHPQPAAVDRADGGSDFEVSVV